jgi:iron(III) transport system permease protein
MSDLLPAQHYRQQPTRIKHRASLINHMVRLLSQGLFIGIGILALLPIAYLIIRAIDADDAMLAYLTNTRGLTVIINSLLLMVAVMVGTLIIGIPFAWLTSRTDLPFRRAWLILGLLPMVTPTYLLAVSHIFVFGPKGILQQALEPLIGIERLPSIYGFGGTWLILTLCTFPYVVLPLRHTFTRMTPALEEAASDLGANRWQVLRYMILPSCRPAIISGAMLAGLYSLGDFGAPAVMRYENFIRVIYLQYTSSFDRHRGALLALVLVLITLVLLALARYADRQIAHTSNGTPTYHTSPLKLGYWRLPALGFMSIIIGLGVMTPIGTILHWSLSKTTSRHVNYDIAELTINTLQVSIVTALIAGGIGILLATTMRASSSHILQWLGKLPFVGYVLPGIVVGLSMVFFTNRYIPALYQTLPILIIAYVVRFLPISLSATQNALAQVNPRLEESAESLGAVRWNINRYITLPLAKSGILGGMALVFLAVMKELPIALMLAPTGFHTLSYRIWSAYQEAIFSQIGLPGLVLITTSIMSLWFILRSIDNPPAR